MKQMNGGGLNRIREVKDKNEALIQWQSKCLELVKKRTLVGLR